MYHRRAPILVALFFVVTDGVGEPSEHTDKNCSPHGCLDDFSCLLQQSQHVQLRAGSSAPPQDWIAVGPVNLINEGGEPPVLELSKASTKKVLAYTASRLLDEIVLVDEVLKKAEQELHRPAPDNRTGEELRSKIECKDTPGYNQTCQIKNAYMMPGLGDKITLLVLQNETLPPMELSTWGGPFYNVILDVRGFPTLDALRDEAKKLSPRRKSGLSLIFSSLYHFNWAHAMFDGLYPAFLGLAKFGRHRDTFHPVVCNLPQLVEEGAAPVAFHRNASLDYRNLTVQAKHLDCAMEDAFRLFGSIGNENGEMERRHDARPNDEWLLLDDAIVGSGHGGEYASVTSLPGTQPSASLPQGEDMLLAFRERIYRSHGVEPPARRSRSHEGRNPEVPLKVIIAGNERHHPDLWDTLHDVASEFNTSLSIEFVKWEDMQPWRTQLKTLRDTDVLVSGIGTALFYSSLLPDGAVTVNLGWKRPLGAWGGPPEGAPPAGPGLPTYGEEFLGMSNRRTRMLYLPLDQLLRGPSKSELVQLLSRATGEIRDGFVIPLPSPEINLGNFGKIVLDLQRRSETSQNGLSGYALWKLRTNMSIDPVVAETQCHMRASGQGSPSDIVLEQNMLANVTESCHVDLQVLRKLKLEHGLKDALGVNNLTNPCDCVVCESCGLVAPNFVSVEKWTSFVPRVLPAHVPRVRPAQMLPPGGYGSKSMPLAQLLQLVRDGKGESIM